MRRLFVLISQTHTKIRYCFFAAAISLGASFAHAQSNSATHSFDMPAQNLNSALLSFADIVGVQIFFDAASLQGLNANSVQGDLNTQEALTKLLEGTGVRFQLVGEKESARILLFVDQQQNKSAQADIQLGPVRVQGATSVSDQVYQTAGSTSVITRTEIERFRGTSVGDIFQGTTGVLVGESRNSGGLDINIRGMQGQSRVPVLIDGSRQETTVYRGYSGVSSRTYVDPDLIGAIDISKGPVMTAEGTGATGGVVSMRTIDANDVIKPGQDWGVRVRGSTMGNSSDAPPAGTVSGMNGTGKTYRINCAVASLCQGQYALPESFGTDEGMDRPDLLDMNSWAGSLALARRFETFDVLVAYAQRDQGNYYTGKTGPIPEVKFTQRVLPFYTEVTAIRDGVSRFRGEERVANSNNASNTFLLKGNWYLAEDKIWELGYQRYKSEYGELMPSQLIWLDSIKQTESSEITAQTFTSRYHWDPTELDWLNFRHNFWVTNTDSINRNYSEDLIFGNPEPEDYTRIGTDISNEMLFQAGGSHTLIYGAALQQEDMKTRESEAQGANNAFNPVQGRNGDRFEFSVFANWQWQPIPAVKVDAGVRYSRAKTDDHKLVVPSGRNENLYDDEGNVIDTVWVESVFCVDENGDGECDPIRYRTDNSGTAPVASVSWEPWQNGLQFYARYAEAFRMPGLFETTQGWSVQPALDVALKPEHTTNKELGINYLHQNTLFDGDRVAVKLAYFHNLTNDYLTRTSPNTWEDGGQIFVMRNIDSVTLHGTELNIEYDAGIAYTKLGGTHYDFIEVCHYGSYRRDRCSDYGVANSYFNNMIPPEWHANATLGLRLFDRRLDMGVRGIFMGQRTNTPQFNDDTARGFNQAIPWHEYTIVDVYATWKHNDTLTVDFNVDNLTDQYYLDALSLGMVPAPGRTARLSLTLNF